MNNHEFDKYIDQYRTNCDKYLALSGEDNKYFAHYKAQKLYNWLPAYHNKKISILDFGCGDGLMTSFVKQLFVQANVTGVDPSGKSIEYAQLHYPNITFAETDGHSLNFQDNSFDIVYAAGAFHHIPFEDHHQHVRNILRVLKPGGHFVMFELNPLNPLTVLTFKRNPIDHNATMMTPWYAHKLLKSYGPYKLKFYCFFPALLAKLRPLESYMAKIPFGALYATISQKV